MAQQVTSIKPYVAWIAVEFGIALLAAWAAYHAYHYSSPSGAWMVAFGAVEIVAHLPISIYWREKARRNHSAAFWAVSDHHRLGLREFHLFTSSVDVTFNSHVVLGSQHLALIKREQFQDVDVAVFDYQYSFGKKFRACLSQTVVWLQRPGSVLPQFAIHPEGRGLNADLIAMAFGPTDINFESHPDFSNNCLLRGPDESAIRRLFNTDVLNFFEEHPGLSVEAVGDKLIYYRSNVNSTKTALTSLVNEARELLARLSAESNSHG